MLFLVVIHYIAIGVVMYVIFKTEVRKCTMSMQYLAESFGNISGVGQLVGSGTYAVKRANTLLLLLICPSARGQTRKKKQQ
jgi:hypothetical protein